jgi:hypothetical protein
VAKIKGHAKRKMKEKRLVQFERIIPCQLRKLTIKEKAMPKLGIFIGKDFYDFTKEIKNIKKEEQKRIKNIIKKELLKRSVKIEDKSDKEVTHLIVSVKDIENLNFDKMKGGKRT